MSIEQLNQQVVVANSTKRHFERNSLQYGEQIKDEAIELVQEIQEALITGCPFGVIGEIGDLYILLAQLCEDLGINPAEAMQYKMIRNDLKYPQYIMNNGYERGQAIKMSKESWKAMGGDYAFSHIYLEHIADEE